MTNTLDQVAASAAKLWCIEPKFKIAGACIQLHCYYTCIDDTPISKTFTIARLGPNHCGTNEIQKC